MNKTFLLIAMASTQLSAAQYNSNPYNTSQPSNSSSYKPYDQSSDTFNGKSKKSSDAPNYSQDSAATESDRQINREIREKLSGWFSLGHNETLVLRTTNGVVIIEGTVKESSDIKEITDNVFDVEGVKNLNMQLIVRPNNEERSEHNSSSNSERKSNLADLTQDRIIQASKLPGAYSQDYAASETDRLLNLRIREKLSTWFTSGYNDTIILKTSNGDVTVEGRVDNPEDIQRIIDSLRRIEGVNNITNRLKANRGSVPV